MSNLLPETLEESENLSQPEEDLIIQSTGHHDHEYMWGALNPFGLTEVFCACGHGLQVNADIFEIKAGKVIKRGDILELDETASHYGL